jgi:hypothetical protein
MILSVVLSFFIDLRHVFMFLPSNSICSLNYNRINCYFDNCLKIAVFQKYFIPFLFDRCLENNLQKRVIIIRS